MATLAELRATILDDLIDSRLTNAQVNRAINDAIGFYEKREFYFNQSPTPISIGMVSGQEYYSDNPIPDIVKVLYLQIIQGGSPYNLLGVEDAEISNVQDGSVQGMPYSFSYIGQRLRLYPIPDNSGTMLISAVVKYSNLNSDSSSNVFTTEGEELIRQSAKRRLALNILHDQNLAQIVAPMEQEALDSLLAETRRRFPQKTLYGPNDLSSIFNTTEYGWQGTGYAQ